MASPKAPAWSTAPTPSCQWLNDSFAEARRKFLARVDDPNYRQEFSKFGTADDVYRELEDIQKQQHRTKTLVALKRIEPYLNGLKDYVSAIDTFSQVYPEMFCLIWVSSTHSNTERVLGAARSTRGHTDLPCDVLGASQVDIAGNYGFWRWRKLVCSICRHFFADVVWFKFSNSLVSLFKKLVALLEEIGRMLPEFKRYVQSGMFDSNDNIKRVMGLFYGDILDLHLELFLFFSKRSGERQTLPFMLPPKSDSGCTR